MSNDAAIAESQRELDELEAQIKQAVEADKAKAEQPAPSPEPEVSPAPEPTPTSDAPVTPNTSQPDQANPSQGPETVKDNPMEWAKKKGLMTAEDMARALQQKEQEFHKRNQAGHPGYRDVNSEAVPPPLPPNWQPAPQMGYGYQQPQPFYAPPMVSRPNDREIAARLFPEINPDDAKVFVPAMFEVANAAARNTRMEMEQKYGFLQRQADRNSELMTLMQDPAWRDNSVQRELHAVYDSDPAIFQRERQPHVYAFEKALGNLARKQLQQGVSNGTETMKGNNPPVTAGGGNGSANTVRSAPTEREMEAWTPEQMKTYMNSNGRIVPKVK